MTMTPILHADVPLVRLTHGEGHYFFGYYDVAAFDPAGRRHLYHKVAFMDRLPTSADAAELGVLDLATGRETPFAATTAWNFQQGAMLQWNPAAPDREVVYNVRDGDGYRAVIRDLDAGTTRRLERPIAALAPDGRWGLSLNFARLFDFRPGYGYSGPADPHAGDEAPEDDGVFRVDLAGGPDRLLISLAAIQARLAATDSVCKSGKLVVNHLTVCPGGDRFVALARTFPQPGKPWGTVAITAAADGSDLYVLNPYKMTSHYHWRDAEHLLAYALSAQQNQLYLFRDKHAGGTIVDAGFFKADGHCSYAPDRSRILYDSYSVNNYRRLYLYDLASRSGREVAALYSVPVADTSIRCDLHPRWRPDGAAFSFDSTHENQRHIYLAGPLDAIS